jgi:Spx/MgsR family transcriptional regulator
MICGAKEKTCWCTALPVLPTSSYQTDTACLCADCLHTQLDTGVVMYGIPNCDTVKKARTWMDEHHVAYAFWDYKKHGVPQDKLRAWLNLHGWQSVCNTRGPTWRKIPDAQRESVVDAASALPPLMDSPSAIKRPMVSWGNMYGGLDTIGFDAALWRSIIKI